MYYTNKEAKNLIGAVEKIAIENGLDPKRDDFTVIQPYSNNQAISLSVTTDNESKKRNVSVVVDSNTIILKEKKGILNVYEK